MTGQQIDDPNEELRADLRRLGALYRTHLQTMLSKNRIAKALGTSRTTPGEWFKGQVPQREEQLVGLVRQLAVALKAAGIDVAHGDQRLLDPEGWRACYRAAARQRAANVSVGVQRAQAERTLNASATQEQYRALPDKPRPLSHWTAQQLGVHPAIPGLPAGAAGEEFVLPGYVEREHDRRLRARLTAVAGGDQAILVVVRGESCAGKTRTAFEAVRACLADWDLVFPKGVDSLLALLAAEVSPRTVLWLNEAQDFLEGRGGEEAAAGLRRLLEQHGPIIIVATLWPADHRTLTTTSQAGKDPHAQARALLNTAAPFDVSELFTEPELRALNTCGDPSLETAVQTSPGGGITQTLAAGPQLVDHYESAVAPDGPYGRAIITAAMDARRLGYVSPLSEAFLEAAAPGYLTAQQRAAAEPGTWFARALGYARQKVMGVAAALEPVAHPTGMGSLPGIYRLADYLDHHARSARRYQFPPATFWTAVRRHAAADELISLGGAAGQRGRYRIAASLYQQAAEAGDTVAVLRLARLRLEEGDVVQAAVLFEQAVDAGVSWGLQELADLREATGDLDDSEALLRRAVAVGDLASRQELVDRLERAGARDEATALAREAAADGDTWLLANLADLRRVLGDPAGAEALLREASDAGSAWALYKLAKMRDTAGDRDTAETLLRQAAEAGSDDALYDLMELRQERGHREEAEIMLQQLGESGYTPALHDLAMAREEAGDRAVAERLAREAGAYGDPNPLQELAVMREKAGDGRKAEQLAGQASLAGDTWGLYQLSVLREKTGDREGAERMAREASAGGHPSALQELARLREEAGCEEDGQRLAWEAVIAGEPDILGQLIGRLIESGDQGGAEQLALDAANCGYHWAVRELARLREDAGDPEEAERIRRFGLDADGSARQAPTTRGW
ncbi:sel1 repeat family protein [Streptomyces sp. NBC_00568]|uniref:tetratricopeptide repeat protein n=1 Tax=Streptomyces sp. NBC_00568 TaxID=2975779 RepID=UPI00225BB500|nr:sel1 repeat family protein [Streptomyces sp. NBC_00568]MCX4993713.1 sel1 repeat family protein [Streptomyces sp. NBC_00568]